MKLAASDSFVKENWLTRKPHDSAGVVIAFTMLCLVLGCFSYWFNFENASAWMPASNSMVFKHHEYWRAWTTLFAHADEKHLLGNLSLFFVIGFFLVGHFGLVLVPLSAFFFGGLVNLLVLSGMPPDVKLIGVSGIVFWMGGAWLFLYMMLETRRTRLQRTLRAGGVALALFMPAEAFDPSISYMSHMWGFIFGILWAAMYYAAKKKPLREAEVWETRIEEVDDHENENGNKEEQSNEAKTTIERL